MRVLSRLVFLVSLACASAATAADATLFRIFLRDGGVLVSFGEFSRVEDRVIFSMPVGGGTDEPRLQVVWVAADAVDWPRTERYADSARLSALRPDPGRRGLPGAQRRRGAGAQRDRRHHRSGAGDGSGVPGAHRAGHLAVDASGLPAGRRPRNRRAASTKPSPACARPRGSTSFELSLVASMPAGGAGADAGHADAGRAARPGDPAGQPHRLSRPTG